MNLIRNCHSPAGMTFCTWDVDEIILRDCPYCQHGTVDPVAEGKAPFLFQCADCGRVSRLEEGHLARISYTLLHRLIRQYKIKALRGQGEARS